MHTMMVYIRTCQHTEHENGDIEADTSVHGEGTEAQAVRQQDSHVREEQTSDVQTQECTEPN